MREKKIPTKVEEIDPQVQRHNRVARPTKCYACVNMIYE